MDKINIDPFGNESALDFFACEIALGRADGFAKKIMRDIFPVLVILVDRDDRILDLNDQAGFLTNLADATFLKGFIIFNSTARREELLVNYLVTNQYFAVFDNESTTRNATLIDFG